MLIMPDYARESYKFVYLKVEKVDPVIKQYNYNQNIKNWQKKMKSTLD